MEDLGNFSVSILYRMKCGTREGGELFFFLKLGDHFIRADFHCACE